MHMHMHMHMHMKHEQHEQNCIQGRAPPWDLPGARGDVAIVKGGWEGSGSMYKSEGVL